MPRPLMSIIVRPPDALGWAQRLALIERVPERGSRLRLDRARLLHGFMRLDEAEAELDLIAADQRGEPWRSLMIAVLRHGNPAQQQRALHLVDAALADTGQNDALMLTRLALLAELGEMEAACAAGWSLLRGDRPFSGALGWMLRHRMTADEARGLLAQYGDYLRDPATPAPAFAHYLALLARSGRREDAIAQAGINRFIKRQRLFAADDPIHAALAEDIRSSPDLFHAGPRLPGRDLLRVEHLPKPGMAAMPRLLQAVADAATHYAAQLAGQDGHRFIMAQPDRARINAWAAIATPSGYEAWHTHNKAWMSGTYYVAMPRTAESEAGAIQFGWPGGDTAESAARGDAVLSLRPEAGELLLFPGYQYHRTHMTKGDDERIVIAFDIVPIV